MDENRTIALLEYSNAQKKPVIMWLIWLFLGSLGVHRYYLGDTKQGVLMTISGLIGWVPGLIWALIDAFVIGKRMRTVNHAAWSAIASKHNVALDLLPEGSY